jgi:hypothetical protein
MSVLRRERYNYPPYYYDRLERYHYADNYVYNHPYYLSRGWPYYNNRLAAYPSYRLS